MINQRLECDAVIELCRQCEYAKNERGKPCYWRSEENFYCKNCIIADNTFAWFKKMVVDENTRKMHEEIQIQFTNRREDEEWWLTAHGFEL